MFPPSNPKVKKEWHQDSAATEIVHFPENHPLFSSGVSPSSSSCWFGIACSGSSSLRTTAAKNQVTPIRTSQGASRPQTAQAGKPRTSWGVSGRSETGRYPKYPIHPQQKKRAANQVMATKRASLRHCRACRYWLVRNELCKMVLAGDRRGIST